MTTNNNPQAGQNRPLPKKEADLFKSVVKFYESKQYKKGIKAADHILKKFPNHGETLAMKGLTLNFMGRHKEAHEFVRLGLRNDMRSHVCWHVFGLLHRSDRNYNEAIKAYKQALRIDPENLQILRDLSLLQIQMRDLQGFVITRHTILTLKPNNKIHWLAYALAKHLVDDREGAIGVMDVYLGTLGPGSSELQRGFESGELALYKNKILAEGGDWKEALDHLEKCKDVVVDIGAWLSSKASYLLLLGQFDDAKEVYIQMFRDRGECENYRIHNGFMCSVLHLEKSLVQKALTLKATDTIATSFALTSTQKQTLLEAYQTLIIPLVPKSQAVRRIPLTLMEGQELKSAIDDYCRCDLTKGVPSLGSDLSALFRIKQDDSDNSDFCKLIRVKDAVDVKNHPIHTMIVDLVDEYITSLSTHSKFPNSDGVEPPSTVLWAWYLRAYLHELCGEYTFGLSLLDQCLEHTPTAVDFYERKARLLKLSGCIDDAANCLDTGRELDKQDRYINNKTTKYLLQAGREKDALERISLFTRHEGNPEQNLFDMQCTWYEIQLAQCLMRKGIWGKSLKKFMAVEKHFEDFHEDQFDFHSYCIRKVTLRAYVDLIRFEDELYTQKFYRLACIGILNNYLHLYDHPEDAKKALLSKGQHPDYSNMTAAEKKKAKAAARKQMQKQKKREENGADGNKKKAVGGGKKGEVLDDDPDGLELLKRDPLEEAKKYVGQLVRNSPQCFDSWKYQYDVAVRRGKRLMALQALFKMKALEPESHEFFSRTVHFVSSDSTDSNKKEQEKSSDNNNSNNSTLIQEIIQNQTGVLLDNKTLQEFVQTFVSYVKSSPLSDLPLRVAVAEVLSKTNSTKEDAASLIVDGGLNGRKVTVDNCLLALKCLEELGTDAKERWITDVKLRFPLATI